jgi:uncharacterized membrane protein (DUF106 family)
MFLQNKGSFLPSTFSEIVSTADSVTGCVRNGCAIVGAVFVFLVSLIGLSSKLGLLIAGIIVGLFSAVVVSLTVWFIHRQSQKRKAEQEQIEAKYRAKHKYVLERKEIIYQYFPDRKHMRYILKCRMRALVAGINKYPSGFKWST